MTYKISNNYHMVDWNNFKYVFLEFIKDIKCFKDFESKLSTIKKNKMKGNYFEYFGKLYFELCGLYDVKKFYLYDEIPNEIKKRLKLPTKDKGIDGILINNNDLFFAIQFKFRVNISKVIPFEDVATFIALSSKNGNREIEFSNEIFVTNCIDVCEELKKPEIQNILNEQLNKICDSDFWNNCIKYIGENKKITYIKREPYEYQKKILSKMKKYFKKNNKGILIMPCGTGKTLTSYYHFITDYNTCFIAVPSLYLSSSIFEEWKKENNARNIDCKYLIVASDCDFNDKQNNISSYCVTTNKEEIIKFIKSEGKKKIVITTYQSSELLINACEKLNFKFDIGIYDEAHRTVGTENKLFTELAVNDNVCNKKLFMTATSKVIRTNLKRKEKIVSMNDKNIYGEKIYQYSMRNAIKNGQLCEYKIKILRSHKKFIKMIENKYIKLKDNLNVKTQQIGVASMVIDSIKNRDSLHILIFSNKNKNAKKIYDILKELIKTEFENEEIFLDCLSGEDSMKKRKYSVNEFINSKIGIISSARIFNEGVDIKICDTVVFAENKSSNIDIVQCIGRCLRKYDKNPNKIGKILLPIITDDECNCFDKENKWFKNILNVIRAIGKENDDEIIEHLEIIDAFKNHPIMCKNDNEKEHKEINGINLSFEKFKNNVFVEIYNSVGDKEDNVRPLLIIENERRYNNGEDLIVTKNDCKKFLKSKGINEMPKIKNGNYVKYATGRIFNKLIKKYCYDINEFKKKLIELNIQSKEQYIKKQSINNLPPYNYIVNGFYNDIFGKFNIENFYNCNDIILC